MADTSQKAPSRPTIPHVSRSFSRMENTSTPTSPRKRASTAQDGAITAMPEARRTTSAAEEKSDQADVFENREDEDNHTSAPDNPNPDFNFPSTIDELPIEIRSLTERFLESLSAKVHPTPLTADALSDLFQDFYERAASHIATHIASLAAQIGREKPRVANPKTRSRASSGASRNQSPTPSNGGEMLTASEVADRRKARRHLELKRLALEDAVERAVCEKVYDRIFKHRSTDDDEKDEKLRSRTASLAVVGIGLKELHMDSDPAKADIRKVATDKEDEINKALSPARDALRQMDSHHYPLGKLQMLNAAHKAIVDTLSDIFPSSSSADEILPALIYTLITSSPDNLNLVSNLHFIQRFRAASKVDGEAAYCLVNLEAAIGFLNQVDLPSLRADEQPEGPPKSSGRSSGQATPSTEEPPPVAYTGPAQPLKPAPSSVAANTSETAGKVTGAAESLKTPAVSSNPPRTPLHQRRLSDLLHSQASRLESGRENFLNAADKVYESINGTLENSLQFVFGRFKDQSADGSPLPKTLEDARRLVSSSTDDDENLSGSGRSSPTGDDPLKSSGGTDRKVLELVGGRRPLRDRSVDSTRSGGSGKRVAFDQLTKDKPKEEPLAAAGNLFAQINPLNRFGVPGFARFGRSTSLASGTPPATPGERPSNKLSDIVESPRASVDNPASRNGQAADEDMNAREALAELKKTKPPKKRFLDVSSASELKIGEVEELLLDYRRLAKSIATAIAP